MEKKFYLRNAFIIAMLLLSITLNAQTHITDRAGLEAIAEDPNGSFILDNDIDLSDADWDAYTTFNGVFDGNGHEILNLTINLPEETRVGLFKLINHEAVVKNLGLVNVNITCFSQGGAIAGAAADGSLISKCYVESGNITASGELVGGFSGLTYSMTVEGSYSKANVTGSAHVGGIIGHMNGGWINDCHVDAVIIATNLAAGGIVGWPNEAESYVDRCFAKGEVRAANGFAAGIVGVDDNQFLIQITDCIAAQDSIMVNDSIVLPANANGHRIITNPGTPNIVVTNNYGFETIPGTWVDVANGLDGANMTEAQFKDETFYTDNLPNWDFGMFGGGVWKMTSVGPLLDWEDDPSTSVLAVRMSSKAKVFTSNNKIYVKDAEPNATLRFYNTAGSLLHETKINSNLESYDFKGFLLIEVVSPKARGTYKVYNQ